MSHHPLLSLAADTSPAMGRLAADHRVSARFRPPTSCRASCALIAAVSALSGTLSALFGRVGAGIATIRATAPKGEGPA